MGRGLAASLEIGWTFNPPTGSHFGGVWERLIRIIKDSLREMLRARGDRKPQAEVFRSALIQAEFILNSRPFPQNPIRGFRR